MTKTATVPKNLKRRKPTRKRGRPTVWIAGLEDRIVETLEKTGCSQRDAAEINGITYETMKERLRTKADFSSRVHLAILGVKKELLEVIKTRGKDGDTRAAIWYLERRYPEEFGRNILELRGGEAIGSASAPANVTNVTNVVIANEAARTAHDAYLAAIAGGVERAQLARGAAGGGDAGSARSVDSPAVDPVRVSPPGEPASSGRRRRED